MKKSLQVLERLTLLNSMPQKGTFKEMRLMNEIKKKVSFTEPEMQKFGISQEGDQIKWFPESDRPVEIDFTVEEMGLVSKRLKDLDAMGEIKDEHLSLWDKFVQE